MSTKSHRDFVILVRGTEEINALVAASHDVFTPATQDVPAFTTEHLTLVFIDPAGAGNQTGEGLRNSIKTQIDVPPVDAGKHFGWREVGPTAPPPEPETIEPDPAVVEAAQPIVETDPAIAEAVANPTV